MDDSVEGVTGLASFFKSSLPRIQLREINATEASYKDIKLIGDGSFPAVRSGTIACSVEWYLWIQWGWPISLNVNLFEGNYLRTEAVVVC
jgi:hypothetical protein